MFKIPDYIDVVTKPPYGDDMTTSFQVEDQWYTMRYRDFRKVQSIVGRDATNATIVEGALKFTKLQAILWVNHEDDQTGIIYFV